MRRMNVSLVAVVVTCLLTAAQPTTLSAQEPAPAAGEWSGAITLSNGELGIAVTLEGGVLRLAIPDIGASFEGSMAEDGSRVEGTWSQGGAELPLTLHRT